MEVTELIFKCSDQTEETHPLHKGISGWVGAATNVKVRKTMGTHFSYTFWREGVHRESPMDTAAAGVPGDALLHSREKAMPLS